LTSNPALTIKDQIETDWADVNVSSRMAKANIIFTTGRAGIYRTLKGQDTRFFSGAKSENSNAVILVQGPITPGTVQRLQLAGDASGVMTFRKQVYQVTVFVRLLDVGDSFVDDAILDRHQVKEEIDRIVELRRNTMTDIKFVYPINHFTREEFDSKTPSVNMIIEVEVYNFEQ